VPANELTFPVGATGLKLVCNSVEYPLVLGTDTFTRTGKDGAEVVCPLFHGDNFVGPKLEGQWKKGWDAQMSTVTPFVAKIASGVLQLSGVAAVAGTGANSWINSQLPLPLLDALEYTVEMEVPISDTGATANRGIILHHFLVGTKVVTIPSSELNWLRIYIDINENGLLMAVTKTIAGVDTILFDGSTYLDTSVRDPAAEKYTIWRLVFSDGVAGATAPSNVKHLHVYLKQGVDRATALAATEHELSTSPFDISTITFKVAYPSWRIYTRNDTYFAAGNEASTGIQVTYPAFTSEHSLADANEGLGDVKLYDTMGSATETDWQRVLDPDHVFVGDAVVQNGLNRVYFDFDVALGMKHYAWDGAAWYYIGQYSHRESTVSVTTPTKAGFSITSISPEKIELVFAMHSLSHTLTLRRSSYIVEFSATFSTGVTDGYFWMNTGSALVATKGFANEGIMESIVATSGNTASPLDNFAVQFNLTKGLLLIFGSKNTQRYYNAYGVGSSFGFYDASTTPIVCYFGVVPFALVANLFKEAGAGTISAAARLYLDGAGEDTVTEGQAVWAATTNCAVDVNDATGPSVGAKQVKITSSGVGQVYATCTPATPFGKLTKFDSLKFYLKRGAAPLGTDVYIQLRDVAGKAAYKAFVATAAPVQFNQNLPHSDTDLQTWAKEAGFSYTTLTTIVINWNAAGAGEEVFIDGLHEYIGTTTTRGRGETLSGGSAVVLDAADEYVRNTLTAGTHLPAGRYIVAMRAKDTDQVASDLRLYVLNNTDSLYRHEENKLTTYKTATAAFAHYILIFDITDSDASGLDEIRMEFRKINATENTILLDYFAIFPIGNAADWPQTLAHNALRTATKTRQVVPV
jgi:hypothetical protein